MRKCSNPFCPRTPRPDKYGTTRSRVAMLLYARKLSYRVAAKGIGIDPTLLYQIAHGQGCGVIKALKIAKYFHKTVEEIWSI
jgi:DNA-binding XRE family transcriptional regulator